MKIIEMLFEIILTAGVLFGMSFVSYAWAAEFKQFVTRAFVYYYTSSITKGASLLGLSSRPVGAKGAKSENSRSPWGL